MNAQYFSSSRVGASVVLAVVLAGMVAAFPERCWLITGICGGSCCLSYSGEVSTMGQRNITDNDPEFGLLEGEELGQGARVKRAPDRAPAFLRFSHLTHYAVDGRDDAQAAMQYVTTIAYTEDQELQRRAIRGVTDLRGMFYRETRNKSQGIIRRDTLDVVSEARGATSQPMQPAQTAQTIAQPETPANAVSSVTDAVRAVKDLQKELAPVAAPVAAVTAADMERMMNEVAARAVEQYKATQPTSPPLDPFAFMERSLSLQEQMRQAAFASNPPVTTPASPVDPAEQFEKQLETYKRLSEIVNPIREAREEGRSTLEKAMDTIGDLARAVPDILALVKPMLPDKAQTMLAGMGMGDATAQQEPQPTGAPMPQQPATATQPANESEAFALILHVGVSDLIRNKRVGRTADLVEEMCRRFPTLNATIDQLCSLTPESALATLESYAQRTDLASLSHSVEWVMNLQDELRPEGDEGDDPNGGEAQPGEPSILEMATAQSN
jgi:hypothetical protein